MRLLVVVFVLLATGCAARLEKDLQSWVGMPVNVLIRDWGPPQSSYEIGDGTKVIQYARSGTMTLPGVVQTRPQTTYHQGTTSAYGNNGSYASGNYQGTSTTYVTQQGPSTNIALRCVVNFTVNQHNFITNWSWQGNNC